MERIGEPVRTGPPAPDAVPDGTLRTRALAPSPDAPRALASDAPRALASDAPWALASDAPRAPRRKGRRSVRIALRVFAVFLLLVGGFSAIAALRLSKGPISLGFLVPALESAITNELGSRAFHMRDAQLAWGEDGLEVQVVDMRVTEPDGAQLMHAPRAVVGLSGQAAWRGRLALNRIALINPRLQAFYTDDGTLSLKFSQPAEPQPGSGGDASADPAAVPAGSGDAGGPIDFVKAVTSISAQARRREHATAYLREIGLKQASLIIDNGRRKTIWKIPEVRIDLSHKASRSVISGRAVMDSLTGPWSLTFQTAEAEATQQLTIQATVSGLNPRGLSRQIPSLAIFEHVDVPLDGEARIELTSKGRVGGATFALVARPGLIVAGPNGNYTAEVHAGAFKGSYDPAPGVFKIDQASLSVDRNRLDVTGDLARLPQLSQDGLPVWDFQFKSTGGTLAPLAPDEAAVPVDAFQVRGQAVPEAGRILLQDFEIKAGGASVAGQGTVSDVATDASRVAGFEARIAPMPLQKLMALWPSTIAPAARTWIATHITRGQLNGGTVKFISSGENRLSLALDIGGTEIVAVKGGPPLEIPRGTLRAEGGGIEFAVPDASIGVEGRRLLLKGLRFTAVDTANGSVPVGEIAFRLLGPVASALDIADREPFRLLKSRGLTFQSPEGRLDGQFKLTLPLSDALQVSDIRVQGRVRLTDGRLRQVLGPHDVTGLKADLDVSETALDVRGDLLLKGIPIKFAGQHFLNTTPDRQSPIRLNLKLDDADRSQLGLDINDLVVGEVPIEITVGPDAKGSYQAQLTGDLTKAELTLDSVAYRKAPGVPARVQFTPVKAAQGRVELRGFKLSGDTIAADGIIILGPDNKARELSFPEFSLNVVTRLDVQGKLRPDNIWEVRAKGTTFDGRDLFRDLFNVQNQQKLVPKDKAGLDLAAEIDTVLGFSDTSLKGVRLTLQRRNDNGHEKTTALKVNATHEGGRPFEAIIRSGGGERKLVATSQDAGQIFKVVGFYPNAVNGRMSLEVSLDGQGAVERNGVLKAEQFGILGDPVVSEVFQTNDGGKPGGSSRKRIIRERIDFDWMTLPFSVGCGQFVMNDMEIRGPLVGASLRGKADFKSQRLQMGGTYVPLSGLNSAIGVIPGVGQLLTGPRGEGIFGITFAVVGPMANPEVIINPLSGLLPGILRETQQLAPNSYRITPCTVAAVPAVVRPDAARASSAGPTAAGRAPTAATPRAQPADVLPDWTSQQKNDARQSPPQQR